MLSDPEQQRRRALMVQMQLEGRGITDPRVLEAMRTVPRHEFVPPDEQPFAYDDRALSIGYGQTISQPYMVALMCELLAVQPHHKVLEIGAGSGYQAALLGQLAREVYAIEIVPQLVVRSRGVLERLGYDNVHIIQADGSLGYEPAAPYDRITVAAGAPELPPPLVDQVVEGGIVVAPVGSRGTQVCVVATKREGALQTRRSIPCIFVPLVGRHGWHDVPAPDLPAPQE